MKILSTVIAIILIFNSIPLLYNQVRANDEEIVWDIHITDIQQKTVLNTIEKVTLYDGAVQDIEHTNAPSKDGYEYLLISLYVKKLKTDESSFELSKVELTLNGEVYTQLNNSFLGNHNINAFSNTELRVGENQGYIVFEIPNSSNWDSGKLNVIYNDLDLKVTTPSKKTTTNISITESMVESQWVIEQDILEDYKLGNYTLENSYVILDPYGWSPLSALVLFQSEKPAKVSVKVHGKDEYTHIEHTFEEMNTFHQIPILGLYEYYENTVEITLEYENGNKDNQTIYIQTEELVKNSASTEILLLESKPELMDNGLTFLNITNPVALDSNGEVRWKYTQSTIILARQENGLMTVCNSGLAYIMEIDMLGKIHVLYNTVSQIHHDSIKLPNGNYMTFPKWRTDTKYQEDRLLELDSITGEVVNIIDLSKFYGTSRFNKSDTIDWLHLNSVVYDDSDSSLILSGRHQGVMKISYPDGELIWFLTIPEEIEGIEDKILTGIDPDFIYPSSQHAAMIVDDQDNNPNTIDILLFLNNRNHASMPIIEGVGTYSALVQYRVNEKDMTVEEIWSWGKDRGYEYFSWALGDADYLSNSNVLGVFGERPYTKEQSNGEFNIGNVVEVSSITNEIVYEVDVKFNTTNGVYRAERLSMYPQTWNYKLYETKGEVKVRNNHETMQTSVLFENSQTQYHTDSTLGEVSANFNDDFADLDILGYQIMNGVDSNLYNMSLVFQSKYITKTVPLELSINETRGEAANETFADSIYYDRNSFNISISYEQLESNLPRGEYKIGVLLEAEGRTQYRESNLYFNTTSWSQVQTEDILVEQNEITKQIQNMYELDSYTLQNPLTIIDPYKIAPLSGISLFETEQPAKIALTVYGLRGGESLTNTYNDFQIKHQIPIYGLYAEESTKVHITATYEDGTTEKVEFALTGHALPEDFTTMEVTQANSSQMAKGLTFYLRQNLENYFCALDNNGDVRFALSEKSIALASGIDLLENGNIVVASEKTAGSYYKNSFYEIDLTGKIYGEYLLEGVHHDIIESNNGNFLALGNDVDGIVKEDTLYEIERNTGKYLNIWDFDDILPVEMLSDDGNRTAPEVYNFNEKDWLHMNSVDQNPNTGEILISGRNHALIISMDYSGEVNYLIGDPTVPLPKTLQDKLLTPVNSNVEWFYGQHNAQFLENGDIMVFDNGAYRSKTLDKQLNATTDGYSRVVIYRVDQENMTVQQIWEYGVDLGVSHLSTYLSGARQLGENHYLINFGGQVFNENGEISYTIADTLTGYSACIQYEIKDGEIIFASSYEDLTDNANVYRVERIDPYFSKTQPNIFTTAQRYGSLPLRNLLDDAEFNFEDSDATLNVEYYSIVSDGVQLELKFNLSEVAEEDEVYMYFKSKDKTYVHTLPTGTKNITQYLSLNEIPEGDYSLYLSFGDKTYNLNTILYQPKLDQFDINVNSNTRNDIIQEKTQTKSHINQGLLYLLVIVVCCIYLMYQRNNKK